MAAVIAARLFKLNNEISRYRASCAWNYYRRTNSENAGMYDVRAWWRTDYSRNTFPLSFYYDRLRSRFRISFAGEFRYYAKNVDERITNQIHRSRCNACRRYCQCAGAYRSGEFIAA